ncbi:MFS transporter [Plantactinospora endophytica]|uniref:MFS transporter n=1 Tax=Plantactinospora endophytica TaxID=673535 RepID=A0ABQ4E6S0_9ACTN|nr:MFS transporter [Plantactinospora endophytica]GIG90402.1 MFS transporter [Plantactinospora endophytica]
MLHTQEVEAPASAHRTIVSACALMFLISLDVTIVNVALPVIQRGLDVPTASLGWTAVAYTIPFATLMLSGGALSDRFGPARVYLGGVVVFGVGSLIDAAAPNFALLLVGRVVQGVGAALCMPSAMAVLRSSVPARQLGQAIALWTFSASVAISAGPIVSGALVEFLSWRSVFMINIPVVALAAWLILPEVQRGERRPPVPKRAMDVLGQSLYVVSSGLLIGGLIFLRDGVDAARWHLPVTLLALSAGGLVAFFLFERRAADPVLPTSLLRHRVFQSAAIAGVAISVVNFGLVYCLGLYYGGAHRFTPLQAGALFLPMMVACGVSSAIVERTRRALGDRATVTAGLAVQLAGTLLICVRPDHVGWVSANAAFLGFGVGLCVPPITAGLLGAVDAKISGVAGGALSSVRQFGSALGVAVLGLMVQGTSGSIRVDLRLIGAVCTVVLLVALVAYLSNSKLTGRAGEAERATVGSGRTGGRPRAGAG